MPHSYSSLGDAQVAALIRQLREDRDVTREQLAEVLSCTTTKIGDLETGRSRFHINDMKLILQHLRVENPEHDAIIERMQDVNASSRARRQTYTNLDITANARRVMGLELQAKTLLYYSGELIPPLLQCESYIAATAPRNARSADKALQRYVNIQVDRRKALTRSVKKLGLHCMLGEAALLNTVGGLPQLAHLVHVNGTMPNVRIQVVPLNAGYHPMLGTTTSLMTFDDPAPNRVISDMYGRAVFESKENEIADITQKLHQTLQRCLSPEQTHLLMCDLLNKAMNAQQP
jgi:hypothetical protein